MSQISPASSEPAVNFRTWRAVAVKLIFVRVFLIFICSFLSFSFFPLIPSCECVVGSEKVGCEHCAETAGFSSAASSSPPLL